VAVDQRILIIEDDPDIGELLRLHFSDCGSEVRLEAHGTRGLILAQARPWDLVVLDWLLPGTDGVAICRRLRAQGRSLPILMLTARSGEMDRIHGLDAGADDYVAKPFSLQELKARVRAQLRRAGAMRSDVPGNQPLERLHRGALCIDLRARTAVLDGQPIALTSREFDLLVHFARYPGRVFTRSQLLAAVWGNGFEGYEHTVNSHINRLRSKIEVSTAQPRYIVTVWGTGYRFDAGGLQ
jgi:DNA-binding response OmpR family regulator